MRTNEIDPTTQAAMVFKKSNKLIQSKFSCTIGVNRLLAMSLYSVQIGNYERKGSKYICKFNASDIARVTGVSATGGTYYSRLKKIAYEMSNLKIFTEDFDNKSFVYMTLVTKAEFKKGILTINFDDEAIVFLQGLTKNYTSYEIQSMMQFKSNYAFRIYEWLRSKAYYYKNENRLENPHKFHIKVELSELKYIVGVLDINSETAKKVIATNLDYPDYKLAEKTELDSNKDIKYKTWQNFKVRVLDQAIAEINEKSDIYVTYTNDRMKKGEISTTIHFYVEYKQDRDRMDSLNKNSIVTESGVEVVIQEDDAIDTSKSEEIDCSHMQDLWSIGFALNNILGESFEMGDVKAIAETSNWDIVKIKKVANLLANNKKNVKNKTGWIISAIQKDYAGTETQKDCFKKQYHEGAFNITNKKNDASQKENRDASTQKQCVSNNNRFTNFKPRSNDYAELQKQLVLKGITQEFRNKDESRYENIETTQMNISDFLDDKTA